MKIFDKSKVEVGSYSSGPIYAKTQDEVRLDISHVTFRKHGDSDRHYKQGFVINLEVANYGGYQRFQFVATDISENEFLKMADEVLFELFLNEVAWIGQSADEPLLLMPKKEEMI